MVIVHMSLKSFIWLIVLLIVFILLLIYANKTK